MKKILSLHFSIILIFFILISFSYAQTFSIEKKPVRDILVSEFTNMPLVYSLNITHLGSNEDYYKFFTLLNANLFPNTPVLFSPLETKEINLTIYINQRTPGKYAYTYYIKNSKETIEDKFTFTIVKADDAFTFNIPKKINRDDKELKIKIKNNLPINFPLLFLEIKSSFIQSKKNFSINANEEKEISFKLDERIKKEFAGKKQLEIILASGKKESEKYAIEKEIFLEEYENVITKREESFIFLGKKILVNKTNTGNNETEVSVGIKVNAFEKLFVKSNILPDEVKKEEGNYVYIFNKKLKPNESLIVTIEINYAWITIILLILIVIAFIYFLKTKERVIVKKSMKRVKTKSGHFALKTFITIKNKTKQTLNEIALLDYLPLSMKYYEYGLTLPDEIRGNKLYWIIGKLFPNEEKTISYLAYSKIKFEGKLVLPRAKLKYVDEKGKHVVYSNSASIFIEKEESEKKQ